MGVRKRILILLVLYLILCNSPICLLSQSSISDTLNPSNIAGTVSFQGPIVEDFQDLFSGEFRSFVKIELWKVYSQDRQPLNSENNDVLIFAINNLPNVQIQTTVDYDSVNYVVHYDISGIPKNGDLAVIAYFSYEADKYQSFSFGGKVLDKQGRNNLNYYSNFNNKIGKDKTWALNSIKKVSSYDSLITDLDFMYSYAHEGITYGFSIGEFFDVIGDFFEDVGELIFEGGEYLAGVLVSAVGDVLIQIYGISYTLVVDGVIPKYRGLDSNELRWAKDHIFDHHLPGSRIILTNLRFHNGRQMVYPNGLGAIYMHLGDLYDSPIEKAPRTFMHELTHAWQIDKYGELAFDIMGIENQIFGDGNVYSYQLGENWDDYNYEQQAEIIADGYNFRRLGRYCDEREDYIINEIREGEVFGFRSTIDLAPEGEEVKFKEGVYSLQGNGSIDKRIIVKSCGGKVTVKRD